MPQPPSHPDRPLECSDCKRPISVHYTEMVGTDSTVTGMCAECPVLQRKLYGELHPFTTSSQTTGLCCGNCGTTLEEVRVGSPLGCSECYEVFEDVLAFELIEAKQISKRLKSATVSTNPIHRGRAPGEVIEVSPKLKLVALTEALDETLHKEDYEQAAWLRDQIQKLKEKLDEGKSK